MKFLIGYQKGQVLKAVIFRHKDSISELYFSYPGIANGRGGEHYSWDDYVTFRNDLSEYYEAGLPFNLLLNGNCYGGKSLSRQFYAEIGEAIEDFRRNYSLSTVTTTSPIIAKFIKANFPGLEVRASVNMEIGSVEAVEYLGDLFDGIYLKREYNYNLAKICEIREYCHRHGKKMYLLANSGCLSFCPVRTFHDNLVAHQDEIAMMDNAYDFPGLCHKYLADSSKRATFLCHCNFIRPEDIVHYDDLCDGIKLATRISRFAPMIVEAYLERKFSGNLLELTEPCYSEHFAPCILANDKLPEDYWNIRTCCKNDCLYCGKCQKMQNQAILVPL